MKNKYEFRAGFHEWILYKDGNILTYVNDFVDILPEVCNEKNLKNFALELAEMINDGYVLETDKWKKNYDKEDLDLVVEAIYNGITCYLD